jgi:N6-L-threonylcarbamoyladenine synthase
MKNKPLILGIDTSCDETAAAVVEGMRVLSNVISSQVELHRKYGGVVPSVARREHELRIDPVINEALRNASKVLKKKIKLEDLDGIAVTYGPGLAIALEIGIAKAKELSLHYHKPLIAVNHMEGHLYSPLALNNKGNGPLKLEDVKFPVLSFLLSGGHTELVLLNSHEDKKIIGQTVDDAIGEAYDKVARMLGLGYPGGKILSEMALEGDADAINLPVPMAKDPSLNMSFSGLKTAVYYQVREIEKSRKLTAEEVINMAASFEKAAITQLQIKLKKAIKQYGPKMIMVGGGVSSSARVRAGLRKIAREYSLPIYFPALKHIYTDNGAMIAIAANFKYLKKDFSDQELDRQPNLDLN